MDFNYSPRTIELQNRLRAFMDENVYPAETAVLDELRANAAAGKRWAPLQVIERLKSKAQPVCQAVVDSYGLDARQFRELRETLDALANSVSGASAVG